ncbi:uncharacterized protein LOC111367456 [Olea europaea var. sylvestris]|uniref:uncharacterized protein LOC111367456 n=1 Tax=Olea europaea var. sylvestris TaxID=158386 RepID=UPI000C1D067C|nr:uncharacterized protein LOC111367456 [Olea europaea var. sylvestris]
MWEDRHQRTISHPTIMPKENMTSPKLPRNVWFDALLTGIKSMHHLQVLKLDDLYVSNISNMVQSLKAFFYLKHFYFRYNYANESIGSYELRHLRQLEGLFLDYSNVDWNFLQCIFPQDFIFVQMRTQWHPSRSR